MGIKRLTNKKQREGLSGIKAHILSNKTQEQISTYIDNHVTNLQSAKEVMKEIVYLLKYLIQVNNLQ